MLKHSVQLELFLILWATKLIYSESPMYTVLDKKYDKKRNIASSFQGKMWLCHSKLSHRGGERHLIIQVEDRLPMDAPSCESPA